MEERGTARSVGQCADVAMGTPLWRRLPAPLPQGGRGGRGELEASGLAAALPASSSHSRLHLLSCLAGHGEWLALCMRGSRGRVLL